MQQLRRAPRCLSICLVKIHGSVLVAKKAMRHTSVLFTRTSISTTSAYCQKIMGDNLNYDVGAIFNRSHCQTRFEMNSSQSLLILIT